MGRDGLSVVEKVALIIDRFLDERATALSFAEILTGTQLSRATTHRVLADMVEQGLLAQAARRDEYRLGPLLLAMGALATRDTDVSQRALPTMERLRGKFGETTVLAELQGHAVVPVRRLDGLHEMRMNQEVGRRYPAHAGATGKVLLAHLGADELAAYLANAELEPITDATVHEIDDLRSDLQQIRRLGVAMSRGERVPEAIAASAPVFDGRGDVVCALTISGLVTRFDRARLLGAAREVKEAAETVSRELGHRRASEEPTSSELKDPRSELFGLLEGVGDRVWRGGVAARGGGSGQAR